MDGNAKQEVAEKLRSSSSVLVTVSKNPSVDQLASAVGLSLMLTKLGKHTTTVFSGNIPNTMEFLDPEKTFDKTVDGLRDFIISLDKDKADKLRYKVEDNVVKVYITPYKSKITSDDLNFSQGDFNVDLVVGLGVHSRDDLDNAITSHGRILHDATIITLNSGEGGKGNLGAVDWTNDSASCLSEMLVSISEALEGGILDSQMSTAFLTGIVAATERFKNDKTTPKLMTMAAQLMAAGANQQLIATNLQISEPDNQQPSGSSQPPSEPPKTDQGGGFAEEDQPMAIDRDAKDAESPKSESKLKDSKSKDDLDNKEETPRPNNGSLADIEDSVHARHNQLDDSGRTQKLDAEDPAIKQLEDELSHDSSTNLIDLEGKLKSFDTSNVEQNPTPPLKNDGPIGRVKSIDASALDPDDKPLMGGTFNATSEQAHDKVEADRNKALNKGILSHGDMSGAPTSHGRDLQPIASPGGTSNSSMPSSEELMHDLQEARRAVEEAMGGAAAPVAASPIQALNAAPIDLDDEGGGDLNLSNNNMTQIPQGVQQGPSLPQPIMQPPAPQQQFNPPNNNMGQQMPMSQPQQQFAPPQLQNNNIATNPMFNLPQPQSFPGSSSPQFNNPGASPQMPQQQMPGAQQLPPMPPNAPPPLPPFN